MSCHTYKHVHAIFAIVAAANLTPFCTSESFESLNNIVLGIFDSPLRIAIISTAQPSSSLKEGNGQRD